MSVGVAVLVGMNGYRGLTPYNHPDDYLMKLNHQDGELDERMIRAIQAWIPNDKFNALGLESQAALGLSLVRCILVTLYGFEDHESNEPMAGYLNVSKKTSQDHRGDFKETVVSIKLFPPNRVAHIGHATIPTPMWNPVTGELWFVDLPTTQTTILSSVIKEPLTAVIMKPGNDQGKQTFVPIKMEHRLPIVVARNILTALEALGIKKEKEPAKLPAHVLKLLA